jgi:D-amino-acid oxidase
MNRRSWDAIVVGGGVSGLTTAVCLAEAGLSVQVWAAGQEADTTSYAAGAIYSPFLLKDDRAPVWAMQTFAVLESLAGDKDTGVTMAFGQEVCREPVDPPAWARAVPSFRRCHPAELPTGFHSGWSYEVPLVDMPLYLRYLQNRLKRSGGDIRRRHISTLDEPSAWASVVVNCTGMGARDLVHDKDLHPIRGELVVVRNPGITRFVAEHSDADRDLTYLLPHRDVVVLGGTADKHRWDLVPDEEVKKDIIARCAVIEPKLLEAEVVDHRVGIRPSRDRVRAERENPNGRGTVILHNYGHGGSGVSISWGCARYVLSLLD